MSLKNRIMEKFSYKNPTNLVFGENQISKLKKLVPTGSRVLLAYGGGSIKSNGVYDQVVSALDGIHVVEFSGIGANPEFTTLMQAVNVVRDNDLDFILAVGGGSVLDGCKFISLAVDYKGNEWDIMTGDGSLAHDRVIPIGAVLTLPATGSEMNSNFVVSYSEIGEKRGMSNPTVYPLFSILDPNVMKTLPQRQIANGIVDSFVHVIEQYATFPADVPLQDRWAEGVMQTLIEEAPKLMNDEWNFKSASNLMICSTMALNGLLSMGTPGDWSVHMIGHELTAKFGIDHARTLAIVLPGVYRLRFDSKLDKLVQYGNRVWNITEGTKEEIAEKAIVATENFFNQLGVDTKISDYTEDYKGYGDEIKNVFEKRKWVVGEKADITPNDVKTIIENRF